tara:strand:- start:1343 stop:1726 length:384 start_codon:yes stop_codon:yes gene_type:complete
MDVNSIEWKDYEMSIALHKTYLEFAIKLNLFHYAITGAILSFHFAKESPTVSILGLFLPMFLSFSLGCFFLYGTKLAMTLRGNIKKRAEIIGLHVYPEGVVLVIICGIFGVAMLTVGLVIAHYLLFD